MTSSADIELRLERIRFRVVNGDHGSAEPWQGARVVIASEMPPREEPGFYPEPLIVRTDFPGELSWLFFELKEAFNDWVDWENKFYFYGTLGETAILYSDRLDGQEKVTELLLCVLDRADELLLESASDEAR
jgi:hypothetical protein